MPPDQAPHPEAYDFIINPEKSTMPKAPLPGLPPANSLLLRVVYLAGGLIILIIVFSVVKGLIVGKPKLDSFLTVAQDQQELIHLSTNATIAASTANLSTGNQNLASTAQLALTSNQSQITKYMSSNHFKVSAKTLGLKVSPALDTQLTNAQSAGTYNQTFQSIMEAQLGVYANDLKRAYQGAGKNGQALLNSDYNQAVILSNQASSPANTTTN